MPIKFRCSHCRQLLGIARAKAGLPVDCPTCGRTVRVPHLDGRVDPLPKPGLNLEDSSLVEALDQVALIGNLPADERDEEFAAFEPEPVVVAAAAAPAPIPVIVEVPLPAPRSRTAADSANGSVGLAEPLAALNEFARHDRPFDERAFARTAGRAGLRGWFAGLAAFAIGLAGFGAGYLVGSRSGTAPAPAPVALTTETTDVAAKPEAEPAPVAARPAIRGRITYRTDAGDSRPDAGARVLVFPQQKQGEVKLAIAGFRAADSAADFQVALAAMRALGGDLAVVGEDGNFEATLPSAGIYQVLVISHYQSQTDDAPLAPPVKRLLDEWFTRPEQLVGRLRYHLGPCRYSGDAVQLWDHSFDAA